MSQSQAQVRAAILDLARAHGVSLDLVELDVKADAIARLSDNTVASDEARLALVNLRRAGALSAQEGHRWLLDLINEEQSGSHGL